MVQHAGRLHVSILTVGELLNLGPAPRTPLHGDWRASRTFSAKSRPCWWATRWPRRSLSCDLSCGQSSPLSVLAVVTSHGVVHAARRAQRPNIVFVFADQWRADAVGYAADPNVKTPQLDQLARQSVNFVNAVSGCPVCCPYRASLLTGPRPLSHGVFLNDVPLPETEVTMAELLEAEGYATAYIGKWHVDGHGRSSYIPPERRQGFAYFKALECTHDYNHSSYFAGDDPTRRIMGGLRRDRSTRDAISICGRRRQRPAVPADALLGTAPQSL